MATATHISVNSIRKFGEYLRENEKSTLTIKKYIHEIQALGIYLSDENISKIKILDYRQELQQQHKTRTVNVKLAAINSYLEFVGLSEFKVRYLKVQRRVFIDEERDLSEAEYKRLLAVAKDKKNNRLYHVMLTICSTGIRVSELRFITVESLKKRKAEIRLKGKSRTVILHKDLARKLKTYASIENIKKGPLFCTKTGKPLDRSNICHDMKKLCEDAKVNPKKVFPHNLRHLFAKSYYALEKDIARLADILGHSSIETTRIYVATCIREYEKTLLKMRLII